MQIANHEDGTASFVLECRARLQNILQRLEWSQESVLKNFNTNSLSATPKEPKKRKQIPAAKVNYYPASCLTNNSFVLATPELQNLLQNDKVEAPNNFHDLQANFSREQKLQIYENVIQNTKKLDNNIVDKVPDGEKSLAQIVAENKREANRKKRKFRIAKPTRIEEVRSLVELQMQSLQQFIRKQKEVDIKRCKTMKEDCAYGKDSRRSLHRRDDSKVYSDRNRQTEDKYKTNRSPPEKYDRFRSNRESSRNSYTKPHTFDNSRSDSTSYRKVHDEYERHRRNRSRSAESRKYHTDKVYKDRETYKKPKENHHSHKRKRSKSLELDKRREEKSSKSKTLDYKLKNVDRNEDRDCHRRSRSREKHRHYEKKYKKSRRRSKSRGYSKRDVDKQDKLKLKHKR